MLERSSRPTAMPSRDWSSVFDLVVEPSVVRRLLTLFYIDDGLATIATTVPRVTHTHQTLITTNA